ncbi:MAG: PEP-CTERM sorting domain-containing protein [Verrucomicrobiales bacterium]|jgi:hypothetical protein|nr:PEP-CTERM sorting domain-containing protein [Verrucomicrobiales bacterium]
MQNKTLWLVAICGMMAVAAQAQVLVNDYFYDATLTGSGSTSKITTTGGGEYVQIFSPASANSPALLNASNSFGRNTMQILSSGNIVYRAVDFSAVTGGSPFTLNSLTTGQTLSLSVGLAFGNSATALTAAEFDLGFLRYTNAATTSPSAIDDPDHNASILYARQKTTNAANGTKLTYRTGLIHMANGTKDIKQATDTGLSPSTIYNLTLSVTKDELGNFLVEYYRDGDLIMSITDALAATRDLEMTGIGFRIPENVGYSALIDHINVSVIPEPSTWLLLMAGIISLLVAALRKSREKTSAHL